jgi:hypothetical protein
MKGLLKSFKSELMKKVSVILIVFAFLGAGCSKDFLSSLQDNPNAPTTGVATPALVLPGTISAIVNVINGPVGGSGGVGSYEYPAVWMGYWNYAPGYSFNPNPQNYVVNSTTPQVWNQYYTALSNLNFIVQQTDGVTKYSNYHGIANILEAVCFKNLVDLYNDVPYSQALKAQGNFYPNYDKGSDVYDSLVLKLDAAIAELQANEGNLDVDLPTTDDVLFGGDIASWVLYANTVKLSALVQQSNVTSKAAFLASEAANTASVGYLTTDALVNPGYSTSLPNPSWANFGISPSGALNSYFTYVKGNQGSIDFYKATTDQRLAYIYSKADGAPTDPDYFTPTLPVVKSLYQADYTGTQQQVAGGVSGIGPGIIKSADAGAPFMTAAESYFWQAEATLYGWLPGGAAAAQTLYQKGITASYEYLGVGGDNATADALAATYYGQDLAYVSFPTGASVDSLDHTIIYQRWAALNSISNYVAYNDWRRTFSAAKNSGIPAVPYSVSPSVTAPHMPFRLPYPLSEINNNNAAWTAAGGPAVATDPYNSKIFWMP